MTGLSTADRALIEPWIRDHLVDRRGAEFPAWSAPFEADSVTIGN